MHDTKQTIIDPNSGEVFTGTDKIKEAPVFFRTPYNYDTDHASLQSGLTCNDPTRTQQQFAEEVDINTIVKRFGLTGQLPSNVKVPIDADFVDVIDYHTALNKIIEADDAFMKLPADIRAEFKNDPGAFVDFASNPENRKRAEEIGLVLAKPKETPGAAAPAPTTPPAGGGVT